MSQNIHVTEEPVVSVWAIFGERYCATDIAICTQHDIDVTYCLIYPTTAKKQLARILRRKTSCYFLCSSNTDTNDEDSKDARCLTENHDVMWNNNCIASIREHSIVISFMFRRRTACSTIS